MWYHTSTKQIAMTTQKIALVQDTKIWTIWLESDKKTVTMEWGRIGGKLQRSSDTSKSKGREGTAAFKTPETVALERIEREVRYKREEGYREEGESAPTQNWLLKLDKQFVPSKPVQKMEFSELQRLESEGRLWIQRKRDGRRHLALITLDGSVRIYSRRMEELTDHLKVIADSLKGIFPPGTILDGEVIIDDDGNDRFKETGRFTNPASKPADAQRTAALYNVRYMVFDCLYLGGQPIWQDPYDSRYFVLAKYLYSDDTSKAVVHRATNLPGSLAQLTDIAKQEKWEGLVCWLKDQPTIVRNGGQPKRCNCIKWKPVQNDDFICAGWEYGSGELSKLPGKLLIAQIDPTTGQLRECGKVGTGFDLKTREEIMSWTFPCVVECKYDSQEPTGKLRFPVFVRKRDDKAIEECIGQELETDE